MLPGGGRIESTWDADGRLSDDEFGSMILRGLKCIASVTAVNSPFVLICLSAAAGPVPSHT